MINNTTNETKEKIREEFRKFCDDNGFNPLREECTDWWLSKLDLAVKEERARLVEVINMIME